MKTTQMNLRVPQDVKEWLFSEAEKDNRKGSEGKFLCNILRPMMDEEEPKGNNKK